MTNQIESQFAKLKLHGMSRTWTAIKETRKNQSLSLSEGLDCCCKPKSLKGITEGSEDLKPMRHSYKKHLWKNSSSTGQEVCMIWSLQL